MKNLILVSIFVFLFVASHAQDTIIRKNGDKIFARVYEIGTTDLKYKKYDNPDGPLYTMPKADVLKIKYENATEDAFKNADEIQPAANTNIPADKPIAGIKPDYKYWPHKKAFMMEIDMCMGDQVYKNFKKNIDAENNFLSSLGLSWITKDESGNVISVDQINKYDYSSMGIISLRMLYFPKDNIAVGGRIGIYSYSQSLSIGGQDESGGLVDLYCFGPSLNWYFYKWKRLGLLMKSDIGLVLGTLQSVPALKWLTEDTEFKDKLPSGFPNLISSVHQKANFTGYQADCGVSLSCFIARWFNIDAGFQLTSFGGSFTKSVWNLNDKSLISISPVFNLSLNFLIKNKMMH